MRIFLLSFALWLGAGDVFAAPAAKGARRTMTKRVRYVFHARKIGNLAYQLDCLARLTRCSEASFKSYWDKEWKPEDDRKLAAWQRLREAHGKDAVPPEHRPDAPYPIEARTNETEQKLRIATVKADDTKMLEAMLDFVPPADRQALAGVVEHFLPRFDPFWRDRQPFLEKAALDLHKAMRTKNAQEFTERVAGFYDSELKGEHLIHLHLLALPRPERKTYAYAVDNHALIELGPDDKVEDRVEAVLLEAFRHLQRIAPIEYQAALVDRFLESPNPDAVRLYNILELTLATALASGVFHKEVAPAVFAKEVARPGALSTDPIIDVAAKSLVDELVARLAAGTTVHLPDFPGRYQDLAGKALGPLAHKPMLDLRIAKVAYEGKPTQPSRRRLTTELRATSIYGFSPLSSPGTVRDLQRYPALPAAMLVSSAGLLALDRWQETIGADAIATFRAAAAKSESLVLATQRGPKTPLYLFFGRDSAALDRAIVGFAKEAAPFTGVKTY